MSLRLPTIFSIVLVLTTSCSLAQTEEMNWYLLKSVRSMNAVQVKNSIGQLQTLTDNSQVWYNGEKSRTFGCKHATPITWTSVVAYLNGHNVFIADITKGEIHHHDAEVTTSIFYQTALYYSMFPNLLENGMHFDLNHEEWEALPPSSKQFFLQQNNYTIVIK